MKRKVLVKRYFIFFWGLILNSFGVAFVTNVNLGTSPIAAIPYSLSMIISFREMLLSVRLQRPFIKNMAEPG